jgi:phenylalanine-4-hydroxylase
MALDWPDWAVFSKNIGKNFQLQINYSQQLSMWQVFWRTEIDMNLVRTAEEKLSLGKKGG